MTQGVARTVLAGLAGGAAFLLTNAILFGLADPILFDPNLQSAKLVAVWMELEPRPLMATNMGLMATILVLLAVGRSFIYRWIAGAWPPGIAARAVRYALLVWFLSYLFLEISTALNLLREPLPLLLLELLIQGLVVLAEGFVVATVHEKQRKLAIVPESDAG